MELLRNLLGLPVLETETGSQIGEVEEVLLDIEKAVVCGIIISGAGWFTTDSGIAFKDLHSIGHDAVMVRNKNVVKSLSEFVPRNAVQLRGMFEKQIFSETGSDLGALVDIHYDSLTGEIKDYEISNSILTDFLYGRMSMPLPQTQVIGQDKLIVPDSMSKLLHTADD